MSDGPRYQRWILERIGGSYAVERLINKNRGGKAGTKGRDFEIAYGLHLVVQELAQIVSAYLRDGNAEKLAKFFFEEQSDCFIDDFRLNGLMSEILVSLKAGAVDWPDVVRDFVYQRRFDRAHQFSATYRLVNGSDITLKQLRARMDAHGLTTAEAEIFHYSLVYDVYRRMHPVIFDAMKLMTGSDRSVDQQLAYRALNYQFMKTEGRRTFLEFLHAASEYPGDFLATVTDYGRFDYLEGLIRKAVSDVEPAVAGRLLRITADGFMQTYHIPFDDDALEEFEGWLGFVEGAGPDDLERALHDLKWQSVVRARGDERKR